MDNKQFEPQVGGGRALRTEMEVNLLPSITAAVFYVNTGGANSAVNVQSSSGFPEIVRDLDAECLFHLSS